MPVRIIFRGLMLFQITDSGSYKKLVAYPINSPTLPGGSPLPVVPAVQPGSPQNAVARRFSAALRWVQQRVGGAGRQPQEHAHYHRTEIQILTGAEHGTDLLAKVLNPRATLDIIVGTKGVDPRASFVNHIPDLAAVIKNGTPAIQQANVTKRPPNTTLIQNVITVDGGIVRARNVTTWDQGGYPLSGGKNREEIGVDADLLAELRFVGSNFGGHVATDVVVEIEDASVELKCDHDDRFRGTRMGSASPSDPHMAPRTVEILVSNYEAPTEKPIPWGLDFQWLFEAAGYNAANLAGSEFDAWVEAGTKYDPDLFVAERKMFFGSDKGTFGLPFPYLRPDGFTTKLTALHPLTRPFSIPTCKGAILAASETVNYQ